MARIPWQRLGRDIVRAAPTPWRHHAYAVIDKRNPRDEHASEEQREEIAEHSPPLTRVAHCEAHPDAFHILPDAQSIDDALAEGELLRGEQAPEDWASDPDQAPLFLEVNDHGNLTLLLRVPACRLVRPHCAIGKSVPLAPYDPDLTTVRDPPHPGFSRISTPYRDTGPLLEQAQALRALAERAALAMDCHTVLDAEHFPKDLIDAQGVVLDLHESIEQAAPEHLGPAYTLHYDATHAHIGHDHEALARRRAGDWPAHGERVWCERVGRHTAVAERIGAYRIVWACV